MPPKGRSQGKTTGTERMSEAAARVPGDRKEDWITLQFRRVYDDALHETVPSEMLDLLSALDDGDEDAADADRAGRTEDDPQEDGTP